MEIINYIGYENRKKNVFDSFRENFCDFQRRKQKRNFISVDYGYSPATIKKSSSQIESLSFREFLTLLGSFVSFVQRNIKKILLAGSAAFILVFSAVLSVKVYSYLKNHSGPLDLSQTEDMEISALNQIMAVFALEETVGGAYNEDGSLVESYSDQKIEQVFSQPVTFQNYKIQNGDTISGITRKFGLKNISTLIAVNDIDNVRLISSGQTLKIPSIDGLIYTVQKGNSIQGISAKYNVALEDLLDVNELESSELQVGQRLFIPGARLDNETLHNALGDRFIVPISAGYRLTSKFGRRADPFTGAISNHTGIDMACPTGTPIYASMSGKVAFVGYSNIFGNYVIINHSKGYQTLYAHMSKIEAKKGQRVSKGTKIGLVGSTGYSTGPHLHFTVYKNGKLVDPLSLLK